MSEQSQKLDLSAYLALLDKDLTQPEQFRYEVTRDAIRQAAYAIPDYNGIYLDWEYARTTRWGGIIAPPGYLYSHGYSTWLRAFPGLKDGDGRELATNDNAMEAWEFILPARPGDTIYSRGKIVGVEEKVGKRIGPFALVRSEMRYTNQRDELVAIATGISFRFNAPKVAGDGGMAKIYPPMPEGKTTRNVAHIPVLPGQKPTPVRRYDSQRYFEDVIEGEVITPWEVGPVMSATMGAWDAVVLGHGWDLVGPLYGGAVPDGFAPGPMRIPWFGTMLSRWAGPNAWITRLSQQNREWALIGFKLICGGKVVGKVNEGGRHFVDCELWCDSELGFRANIGNARIELPSRK